MIDMPARGAPFRPSRTCYPGSKFGPKTRYDLPQRHKAYGNADETEAILYAGSSLQPLTDRDLAYPAMVSASLQLTTAPTPRGGGATPRGGGGGATASNVGILSGAARSLLHPLADRNLPDLPLIDDRNDVHGILCIGGKGVGKTSLVLSLTAVVGGSFPNRYDLEIAAKKNIMPTYGQPWELSAERDVKLGSGSVKSMRLVLTDTLPCGTNSREGEQPLCAAVSPNCSQHFNAIPSWMRITMRGGNFPHYAVLFVLDASQTPLWEDHQRCRDLARLLAVLKRSQYTVVLAVTKMLKARECALRDVSHGVAHGSEVRKDPKASYESYAGRYIEKVSASIQGMAEENDWSFSCGPDSPPFPLMNATIFDAPTWVNVGDWRSYKEKRGTAELPNWKYATSQLNRLLLALSCRSHPEL